MVIGRSLVGALAIYWALAVPAFGAQPRQNDIFKMSLEELLTVKVSGATLSEASMEQVPSSVTVFTRQQLDTMAVDSLAELMNFVPGFQSYRSSSTPIDYPFSARGRRIGIASAEVLVLVDGQRLNDARTSGSSTAFPQFNLSQIERVEFIRGPGSALYGSNALMGVINIVTLRNTNSLEVIAGDNGTLGTELALNYSRSDLSVDFLANLKRDDGDSFDVSDRGQERITDPHNQHGANLKVTWRDTSLTLQQQQYHGENFISFTGAGQDVNYSTAKTTSAAAIQNFSWFDINSTLRLSYSWSEIEVVSQATGAGVLASISSPASNEPLITKTSAKGFNELRVNQANDWRISNRTELQFGWEYRKLDVPSYSTAYNYNLNAFLTSEFPIEWYGPNFAASRVTQFGSRRDIVGAYTQLRAEVLGDGELTLGLRHDSYSGIGSKISPRVGLVKPINKSQTLKLLYGEAFRAPSEEELNLAPSSSISGNSNLAAETVKTLELIWLGRWRQTQVSASGYINKFDKSIGLAVVSDAAVTFINSPNREQSKGVELEFSHEVGMRLMLNVALTRQYETLSTTYREASNTASASLNYQHQNWNGNVGITYRGKSDMLLPDNSLRELGASSNVFAKVQYRPTTNWQIYLKGKNILNNKIETPPNGAFLTYPVPSRGRELVIGVAWQF